VWAVLELLVYPARYQWNDVHGFVADQQHPGVQDRGRLPGPLDRARERVLASSAVALPGSPPRPDLYWRCPGCT
jgi:hypothetical protein